MGRASGERSGRSLARPLAVLAALALAGRAAAADEEIQVYMDEMNPKGGVGLDLHTNYVAAGDAAVDWPGEQSALHRWRLTPEWSYGLADNLELGLYLPLVTVDRRGSFAAGGVKGRIKFIAPRAAGQSWFWGVNLEVGRVGHALDVNPWNAELKGILGTRRGRWTVAANLNLDWTLSGPHPAPASLELASKVGYRLAEGLDVGVESYNGLGSFRRFARFGEEGQATYAVIDKSLGRWDLNLGVGRGYGAERDGWVLKAVIGVPIDH